MSGLAELFGDLRGVVTLGVVQAVVDSGAAQTVVVQTATGALYSAVEVAQPFGFASVAPAQGAICLLLAVGADPANLVALPLGCPAARYGSQAAGEAAMYAADGTRVAVRQGGLVEIWGGTSVTVHTKGVTVNAPNGVAITGNVAVTGSVTATGDVSDGTGALSRLRGHYDSHTHPGVTTGAGSTGTTDAPD